MKNKTVLSGALSTLFLTFALNITAHAGAAAPLPPSSIGDIVWNDLDGNGVQDVGEPGLVGIDVHLCGAFDATTIDCSFINLFDTTDGSGAYLFEGFERSLNNAYMVEVSLATVPSGFIATTPTSLYFVDPASGNPILTADFGFQAVPVPAAAWLFGSGLLGLLGMARRKRAV
jgi:hypothetical protein